VRETNAPESGQVFGLDVEGWKPGEEAVFDGASSATRQRPSAT